MTPLARLRVKTSRAQLQHQRYRKGFVERNETPKPGKVFFITLRVKGGRNIFQIQGNLVFFKQSPPLENLAPSQKLTTGLGYSLAFIPYDGYHRWPL